jgi:hypothetical protein
MPINCDRVLIAFFLDLTKYCKLIKIEINKNNNLFYFDLGFTPN